MRQNWCSLVSFVPFLYTRETCISACPYNIKCACRTRQKHNFRSRIIRTGGGGFDLFLYFFLSLVSSTRSSTPDFAVTSSRIYLSPIERMMPLEQLLSFPPSIEGRATVAIPGNDRYPRLVRRRCLLLDSIWILSQYSINCSRIEGRECRTLEKRYDIYI